jgi:hypothetical protein
MVPDRTGARIRAAPGDGKFLHPPRLKKTAFWKPDRNKWKFTDTVTKLVNGVVNSSNSLICIGLQHV